MNDKNEYELINVAVFNPAYALFKQGRKEKAQVTKTYCKLASCPLREKGECIHLRSFDSCKYGKTSIEKGYTTRAKGFSDWIIKQKTTYKAHLNKLKPAKSKLAFIGDFVWLPYLYLSFKENKFLVNSDFGNSNKFLRKEFFTMEMIACLINRKPKSWMGGEIKEYQTKEVPLFTRHLQEGFPKIWADFKKEYPELAEKHKIKNYIGRKAYLDTVVPNVGVFEDETGKWVWDGNSLFCEDVTTRVWYSPFEIRKSKARIFPQDRVVVNITDNNQVNKNTVFVD